MNVTISDIDYNLRFPPSLEPKIPESAPKNYTLFRVLKATLPLVVLVPSIAQALQYVAGIASCYESAKNLRAKPDEKLKNIASLSFNVTSLALLAINPLAISILQSSWDGLQESIQMSSHLVHGEYKEAAWHGVKVAEKSIYIASILVGGPELVLISMVAQISFEILKLNQFRVLDMKLELSVQFAVIGVRSYGVYNHLKLHEDHFQKAYKKVETQFFQLIGKYQKICGSVNTSPLLNVIGVKIDEFNDFIKAYASSVEKTFGWSEVVYALEKDYPDEIVLFCLDKIGTGNLQYSSRVEEWNVEKSEIIYKHAYFTCVRKNRVEALKFILKSSSISLSNVSEYVMRGLPGGLKKTINGGTQKIHERELLNFLIEKNCDSMLFINIFNGYGLELNKNESYNDGIKISKVPYYSHNRTPLMSAILQCKLDVVNFLLENGVIPNCVLKLAVTSGNLDIVNALLEKNACVNDGSLLQSIYDNNLDMFNLLINKNANINNHQLVKAVDVKNLNMIKTLLEKGANVNEGSLLQAVLNNYVEAVDLLLKHNANPFTKIGNKSAYEAAVQGTNEEIIKLMSNYVLNK